MGVLSLVLVAVAANKLPTALPEASERRASSVSASQAEACITDNDVDVDVDVDEDVSTTLTGRRNWENS